jgi:hypothetical protein
MGAITVLDYLKRNRVKNLVHEYYATEEFANLKV